MDTNATAPFRRQDKYGELGVGKIPLVEKCLLYARAVVLVPFRAICLTVAVCIAWCYCALCRQFPASMAKTASLILGVGCRYLATLTAMSVGIVYVKYEVAPGSEERTTISSRDAVPLLVCNHSSWADILLVSSLYTPSYVSKIEVRKAPLVGYITAAVGSIFVNRKAEKAAAENHGYTVTDAITKRLKEKEASPDAPTRPLCIFPEGTTTNGRYLLPFHSGAFRAGVAVKPILIRYNRSSHVDLAYETIPVMRHMFLVFANLWHSARLVELPMYHPSEEEKADAKLFASNVRQYMADWSVKLGMPLTLSDSTFKTKQEYHKLLKEQYGIDDAGRKKKQ